jgi:glycosyltransferase involved in cell wall biosynthesis
MYSIRNYIADHVVYQSEFVKSGWIKRFGDGNVKSSVIYNGIDLNIFNPSGSSYKSPSDICIISVEGTQGADGFRTIINLGRGLATRGLKFEVLTFGKMWPKQRDRLAQFPFVKFKGLVANAELPYFYRGAACFVSTDIVTACPNSVIEALACGTPVIGCSVGVLPEMLNESSGICVDWSNNPKRRGSSENYEGMGDAVIEIINGGMDFRSGARQLAEERYNLKRMVDSYMQILFP